MSYLEMLFLITLIQILSVFHYLFFNFLSDTFSDHMSALSKSCYSHIRQLCCHSPYLDLNTASTIATSTVL